MKIYRGSSRQVFIVGKYVIKIPTFYSMKLFLIGCSGNWNERQYCKQFKNFKSFYNIVAPSYFCSWFGLLQIQAKVEQPVLEEINYKKFKRIASDDMKIQNFGYYQGKIVCCDYQFS